MTLIPLVEALKAKLDVDPLGRDLSGRTLNPSPVASPKELAVAETAIGFTLPQTLREIYLFVANGGFGPGYGVLGVGQGFSDDRGDTVERLHRRFSEPSLEDPSWRWEPEWTPFCHWGCGIYSVVSCVAPHPVLVVDPGNKDDDTPMSAIVHSHKATFDDWLSGWLRCDDLWSEVWG